jgi:hypothetical protein
VTDLVTTLAGLLNRAYPIPDDLLADATAAGLRLARREPRLPTEALDLAWLLPA